MLRFFLLWIILVFSASNGLGLTRLEGDLDGVGYIVDVPDDPSGKVMFIARGFRPDFFPVSAVYEVGTDFYQRMLADGWTIASSAFRSNDWVVASGGEDIIALRAFVDAEVHPIRLSILYGETMGGGVAVWLAENHPELFDGVLCLGAHLFPEPGTSDKRAQTISSVFNLKPQMPVVFLANGEEMQSSRAYLEGVNRVSHVPATYYVERTGHVNVNSSERLAAMRGLLNWIAGERMESVEDGTILMSPESSAARSPTVAAANVRLLRPLYGNIYTTFVASDLEALGIELSDSFQISHRDQLHTITYAQAYSDVPYGAWVAFIDPEGYIQVSRNYANAADTLGAEVGDPLLFLRVD
ncbi:MAG: SAM hydroxide adenosyltransferase [Verrucomicrobiota bacterium]